MLARRTQQLCITQKVRLYLDAVQGTCTDVLMYTVICMYLHTQVLSKKPARVDPFTTGNWLYAECPILCREQNIGHSAKLPFAESYTKNTRQRNDTRHIAALPSATYRTLGKDGFTKCQMAGTRHTLPLPSAGSRHSATPAPST